MAPLVINPLDIHVRVDLIAYIGVFIGYIAVSVYHLGGVKQRAGALHPKGPPLFSLRKNLSLPSLPSSNCES